MKKNKWTHPGNLILLGFAAMLVFISFLVYKSTQIDFQMTSKDYYEDEFKYNDKMIAEKNALPLKADFLITNASDHLEVHIPTSLSANFDEGNINFYCPSDATQDKRVALDTSADGKYMVATQAWKKTGYRAQFTLIKDEKEYYIELPVSL